MRHSGEGRNLTSDQVASHGIPATALINDLTLVTRNARVIAASGVKLLGRA